MNFLKNFFKKSNEKVSNIEDDEKVVSIILNIVACITDNNQEVKSKLEACIKDSNVYLNMLDELYGIPDLPYHRNNEELYWVIMIDVLCFYNYVSELDWKIELEDFLYNLEYIKNIIEFDNSILREENENGELFGVDEWCKTINSVWEKEDMCIAQIEKESDSYVLLPCTLEKYNKILELSKELSYTFYKWK